MTIGQIVTGELLFIPHDYRCHIVLYIAPILQYAAAVHALLTFITMITIHSNYHYYYLTTSSPSFNIRHSLIMLHELSNLYAQITYHPPHGNRKPTNYNVTRLQNKSDGLL
jgi:hypothetical protein